MSCANPRRITRLLFVAAVLSSTLAYSPPSLEAQRPLVLPATIEARLIGQNFNVSIGKQFRFVISIPNSNTKQELLTAPDAVLRIEVHAAVSTRQAVRDIAQLKLTPSVIETIDIALNTLGKNETKDLVALVANGSEPGNIGIRKTGVYPMTLSLLADGKKRVRFTTFVNFITGQTSNNTLAVSLVADVTPPLSQLPNGSIALTDAARSAAQNLVGALSGESGTMSVRISPELLNSLALSTNPNDVALLGSLQLVLSRHQVIASTFVPFDTSSAQVSGLQNIFAQQLNRGNRILELRNGGVPIPTSSWFSTRPITQDGIALLASLGFTNLVFSPNAAQSFGALDTYSMQYRAVSSDASSPRVSLAVPDPNYANSLSGQARNPVLASMAIAAELVVQHGELISRQSQQLKDHVIVSSLDGGLPSPVLINSLLVALSRAPQIALRPISSIAAATAASTPVVMPETMQVDLSERRATIANLVAVIASTNTMLESSNAASTLWDDSLLLIQSDALNADRFADYVKGLNAQLRSFRAQVNVPESLTFTLGGKTSDLRLQLRNNAGLALTVLVTVSSAKLTFPEKPQLVTIAANSATDLIIPVVARANGTFPLEVVLYTPDGITQVGQRIRLSARVSALAGLGQLVTGVAILLLLSWWVAHWRKQNRAKAVENHPALRSFP